MRPRLVIAPGREAAILRRHPWIFSGAVKRIVGNPQEGDMVDVVAADGTWLAAGHYQNESIVCKVLTFDAEENSLTEVELLRRRLQSAIDYRRRLGFFDYLQRYAGVSPAEFRTPNSELRTPTASNVSSLVISVARIPVTSSMKRRTMSVSSV